MKLCKTTAGKIGLVLALAGLGVAGYAGYRRYQQLHPSAAVTATSPTMTALLATQASTGVSTLAAGEPSAASGDWLAVLSGQDSLPIFSDPVTYTA